MRFLHGPCLLLVGSLLLLGSGGPAHGQGLKQDDEEARSQAAVALGVLGLRARKAIPALIELLKDDESSVRMQAVKALAQIARDNVQTVPALVGALGDREPMVRAFAAMA